eukprot:gene12459-15661_t
MGSHDDFDSVSLLRDDDSLLRQIDVVYALSQAWCTSHSDDEFTMLEGYLKKLAPEEMVLIASSLSHMLNLHNLSEEVSAAQTGRKVRLGEVSNPTRTTNKSLLKLISENGYSPEELYKALRGSLLKKYATIRKEMDNLHTQHMSNFEKTECLDAIKASVQAAWRTDEIRRLQPSPQDEARGGMAYFSNVIFDVIPVFHRRIDTALATLIPSPKLQDTTSDHEVRICMAYFNSVIFDVIPVFHRRIDTALATLISSPKLQDTTSDDEARGGSAYFNNVIFDVIPVFHRRIDTVLTTSIPSAKIQLPS